MTPVTPGAISVSLSDMKRTPTADHAAIRTPSTVAERVAQPLPLRASGAQITRAAEEAGFDRIVVTDHLWQHLIMST